MAPLASGVVGSWIGTRSGAGHRQKPRCARLPHTAVERLTRASSFPFCSHGPDPPPAGLPGPGREHRLPRSPTDRALLARGARRTFGAEALVVDVLEAIAGGCLRNKGGTQTDAAGPTCQTSWTRGRRICRRRKDNRLQGDRGREGMMGRLGEAHPSRRSPRAIVAESSSKGSPYRSAVAASDGHDPALKRHSAVLPVEQSDRPSGYSDPARRTSISAASSKRLYACAASIIASDCAG